MGSKNYNIGRAFERRVKERMEKEGWYCTLSAGSHSPTDILCVKRGKSVGIQCRTGGRLSDKELDELQQLGEQYGFIPLLALRMENHKIGFKRLDKESKNG